MKNNLLFNLLFKLAPLVLAGCTFLMGPDEPVGENTGTLTVSFGEAGGDRVISSGKDLPAEVLAALRYEVSFTGPGNNVINRTVSGGGTVSLTLIQGLWRIDASAYYGEALAGTGSLSFDLIYENTSVRIPMYMSGPLYEITIAPMAAGTAAANFSHAFPGTPVALTVTPIHEAAVLKPGTLTANGTAADLSGSGYTFTMPATDVTVAAEFLNGRPFVKAGAAGTGLNWDDASGDLQKMMDEAAAAKAAGAPQALVRVAAGTYKPRYKPNADGTTDYTTPPNDRDSSFILRQGVEVRGGYPAAGGDEASRNPGTHVTTLNGDLNGDNTANTGDAYHVVLGVNIPAGSGTILDGLTLSGAYAQGSNTLSVSGQTIYRDRGGGIHNENSSPALIDVTIAGNTASSYGGGLYNKGHSSPALTRVTISGNTVTSWYGGGMYNEDYSSPVLTQVTIAGNTTGSNGSGGGMYNTGHSSPVLTNVIIAGNTAGSSGGGIYNYSASSPVLTNVTISGNIAVASNGRGGGMNNGNSSSPVLTNVTIAGNTAGYAGGGIANDVSAPVIRNSVIWGNTAVTSGPGIFNNGSSPNIAYSIYSIVQGSGGSGSWDSATGTDGGNNLDTNPLFADQPAAGLNTGGNYRLQSGSPAINAGSSSYFAPGLSPDLSAVTTDLAGNTRFNGVADMGAYEH
ncbi:MAG: right-handed parallel beta-helix repeat-containing protein [Treponema sp.]|jgi:hypothetical protein|nr:right-handed parallel beta-helix repeat-containing protein [Treponema sp.]